MDAVTRAGTQHVGTEAGHDVLDPALETGEIERRLLLLPCPGIGQDARERADDLRGHTLALLVVGQRPRHDEGDNEDPARDDRGQERPGGDELPVRSVDDVTGGEQERDNQRDLERDFAPAEDQVPHAADFTRRRSARDRATITPTHPMSSPAVAKVAGAPAPAATAASATPPRISPTDSDCARKECIVARTSLATRRLIQITLTARVTLAAITSTSRTPTLAVTVSGA